MKWIRDGTRVVQGSDMNDKEQGVRCGLGKDMAFGRGRKRGEKNLVLQVVKWVWCDSNLVVFG